MKPATENIFSISNDSQFKHKTLEIFHYQAKDCEVYNRYINTLKIDIDKVSEIDQIPFLPIEFFKTHTILSSTKNSNSELVTFTSSGTTHDNPSCHYVKEVSIYEKSYLKCFELFYGNIKEYTIFALLPSYLERNGSSLIHMVNDLIDKSESELSKFYLNDTEELIKSLMTTEEVHGQFKNENKKNILIGVTYALLDLVEKYEFSLKNTIIMETGGMKGKRKELVKQELHFILKSRFGVSEIHSEYGMTELLSQAYSKGNGLFVCPPWMKVLIRDINDPLSILPCLKTGGINVIDLANIHSCSFIATQDLGIIYEDGSFEVIGRFDNSDIRGCNLLVS
ncbi:MAG: acyl transferase [Bacteroidota bacterium]